MDGFNDGMVEGCDAVVIEFGGNGSEDRHLFGGGFPLAAVALDLLADIPDRILTAPFFEFVDHHQIGIVEHVDFFQLGRSPELTGHDIHGEIAQVDDVRIPLSDAGGFGDDQVIAGSLGHTDHLFQGQGNFRVRVARCQRPHIDSGVLDGVHADSVAQQRAAGFAPRRVTADDGDAEILHVVQKAQDQFVGEGGFARSAGSGNAHHRDLASIYFGIQPGSQFVPFGCLSGNSLLHGGHQPGHHELVVRR